MQPLGTIGVLPLFQTIYREKEGFSYTYIQFLLNMFKHFDSAGYILQLLCNGFANGLGYGM